MGPDIRAQFRTVSLTRGNPDLYQCFVNGTPFNELTVKASTYERIVAELGTRAQEMEQSNVRAGDTSSVQQFATAWLGVGATTVVGPEGSRSRWASGSTPRLRLLGQPA